MSSEPASSASQQSPTSPPSPSSLHLPENRRVRDRSPSPMRGYLIPSPLPTRRTRTFSAWVLGTLRVLGTTQRLPLGTTIEVKGVGGDGCVWKMLWYFISSPINSGATRLLVQIACSFSVLCLHKGCSKPFPFFKTRVLQGGENTLRFFKNAFLVWSFSSPQTRGCGSRDHFLFMFLHQLHLLLWHGLSSHWPRPHWRFSCFHCWHLCCHQTGYVLGMVHAPVTFQRACFLLLFSFHTSILGLLEQTCKRICWFSRYEPWSLWLCKIIRDFP